MSLAPRPASPGTDVPSRNRSAPLELYLVNDRGDRPHSRTGYSSSHRRTACRPGPSSASRVAARPETGMPTSAAEPVTSGPEPRLQSRSVVRQVTLGRPPRIEPIIGSPEVRKSRVGRQDSAGRRGGGAPRPPPPPPRAPPPARGGVPPPPRRAGGAGAG